MADGLWVWEGERPREAVFSGVIKGRQGERPRDAKTTICGILSLDMGEVYYWHYGDAALAGWICLVVAGIRLFALKRKEYVSLITAAVAGISLLAFKPNDSWAYLGILAVLAGFAADRVQALKKEGAKKPALIVGTAPFVLFGLLMASTARTDRKIVLSQDKLSVHGGSVLRPWSQTIPRSALTATLVHASGSASEWRFRSSAKEPTTLFIDSRDQFRNRDGQAVAADVVSREVLRWSGARLEEKTVAHLYPQG